VLVEFGTIEQARAYAQWASAPERRDVFSAAGVIPPFDRYIVESRRPAPA
jgi:hypothetical protein